ncbi:MAG: NUDIX domain-containing protein [Phaeodactylibacter sp.]|nr:NUDIX domain-containing protein [Phaeodactylibacter sp.]
MESTPRLQLGSIPPETPFYTRPGSYAVFFNEKNEAGVIRNDYGDYFLAGGGIEPGETAEEALLREVQEEAGLLAEIDTFLGMAAEYFYDAGSRRFVNKVGHFFLISPYDQDLSLKVEADHTLLWMPLEKAYPLMYHDIYRWALEEAERLRENQ